MSRTADVLRNRNKAQKKQKERRREELESLSGLAEFKAKMHDELKTVDMLLNTRDVDGIVITVEDVYLSKFGEAIYSADLTEYEIQQIEGHPNKFRVRHKIIQF